LTNWGIYSILYIVSTDEDPATLNPDNRFARDLNLHDFQVVEPDYLPDNVNVLIRFGLHYTEDDLEGVDGLFKACDIFIPEARGWDDKVLAKNRALSKGYGDTYNQFREAIKDRDDASYYLAWKRLLDHSRKAFEHIDANAADMRGINQYITQRFRTNRVASGLEATLDYYADYEAGHAYSIGMRDVIIARNLGSRVTRLVSGHPRLRKQSDVNTLVLLGLGHYKRIMSYFLSQPFLSEKVTTLNGAPNVDVDAHPSAALSELYLAGGVPTRELVVRKMAHVALSAIPSTIYPGRNINQHTDFFDHAPLESQDEKVRLARTTLDLIARTEDQELLETVARATITDASEVDIKRLQEYERQAYLL
jgi:hypothetical protein